MKLPTCKATKVTFLDMNLTNFQIKSNVYCLKACHFSKSHAVIHTTCSQEKYQVFAAASTTQEQMLIRSISLQ